MPLTSLPNRSPPQWSDEQCAAHLTQRDGYQAATQGQLKDQLYQQIINYFDKGKVRHTHTQMFWTVRSLHLDVFLKNNGPLMLHF